MESKKFIRVLIEPASKALTLQLAGQSSPGPSHNLKPDGGAQA